MTEAPPLEFPNDADGDALRRLAEDGNDLTRPMQIDFTVSVPSLAAGHAVAQAAQEIGYRASVEHDEEGETWTCYCSRHMVASYDAVILAQEELNRLSAPHGGHCDGWGSFGSASESNESDPQR
jgi:regulator of RNase E activity RraB